MLSCLRARRRIGAYFDGALAGKRAASLERHLAACAACRKEADALQRMKLLLRRALSPAAVAAPPDWTGFWPGVLRGIEDARRAPAAGSRGGWRRARWALGGALVAALLVLATLWRWQAAEPPEAVDNPIVVSSADTDQPGGSVMVYHTPERDIAVVWVFDEGD